MRPFDPIALSDIQNRILPTFGSGRTLTGLMLYGSRAVAQHRPNSDWDLMALVDSKNPFYGEFHGHLMMQAGRVPVEMRLYSVKELESLLDRRDAIRLSAMSKGIVVYDKDQVLSHLQIRAKEQFSDLLNGFRQEIEKLNFAEICQMMQTTTSETRLSLLHSLEEGFATSALAVLIDLITDFVVYSEILRVRVQGIPFSTDELTSLYFLRRGRGGRFFKLSRYPASPRLHGIIAKLDRVLSDPVLTMRARIEYIFTELDISYMTLVNQPLILPPEQWPETKICS